MIHDQQVGLSTPRGACCLISTPDSLSIKGEIGMSMIKGTENFAVRSNRDKMVSFIRKHRCRTFFCRSAGLVIPILTDVRTETIVGR